MQTKRHTSHYPCLCHDQISCVPHPLSIIFSFLWSLGFFRLHTILYYSRNVTRVSFNDLCPIKLYTFVHLFIYFHLFIQLYRFLYIYKRDSCDETFLILVHVDSFDLFFSYPLPLCIYIYFFDRAVYVSFFFSAWYWNIFPRRLNSSLIGPHSRRDSVQRFLRLYSCSILFRYIRI